MFLFLRPVHDERNVGALVKRMTDDDLRLGVRRLDRSSPHCVARHPSRSQAWIHCSVVHVKPT